MSLESLIGSYGYLAVGIGTFLEGETILILGGISAHRGYLQLPWVMLAAFFGTLAGDQLYFYLGRSRGRRMLERRPGWQARSQRVLSMLERRPTLLILGFRFLYGIRTVAPFVIGMSGVSPARYLVLNALGAALWSVVIGAAGYAFGHALSIALDEVKHYEVWILGGVTALGMMVWSVSALLERSRRGRHDAA